MHPVAVDAQSETEANSFGSSVIQTRRGRGTPENGHGPTERSAVHHFARILLWFPPACENRQGTPPNS